MDATFGEGYGIYVIIVVVNAVIMYLRKLIGPGDGGFFSWSSWDDGGWGDGGGDGGGCGGD